jgi:hypothetical protein
MYLFCSSSAVLLKVVQWESVGTSALAVVLVGVVARASERAQKALWNGCTGALLSIFHGILQAFSQFRGSWRVAEGVMVESKMKIGEVRGTKHPRSIPVAAATGGK